MFPDLQESTYGELTFTEDPWIVDTFLTDEDADRWQQALSGMQWVAEEAARRALAKKVKLPDVVFAELGKTGAKKKRGSRSEASAPGTRAGKGAPQTAKIEKGPRPFTRTLAGCALTDRRIFLVNGEDFGKSYGQIITRGAVFVFDPATSTLHWPSLRLAPFPSRSATVGCCSSAVRSSPTRRPSPRSSRSRKARLIRFRAGTRTSPGKPKRSARSEPSSELGDSRSRLLPAPRASGRAAQLRGTIIRA